MPGLICPGIKDFLPNPQNLNELKTGDQIGHLPYNIYNILVLHLLHPGVRFFVRFYAFFNCEPIRKSS